MNFKKFLALLLSVIILLGALPFTTFAQTQNNTENISVSSSDISLAGTNSVGNMLADELEEATEQTENSGNVIYSVEIENYSAFVDFSTVVSCTLFVGIYTEDTSTMLASGYTEVTPQDEYAYVDITGSIPQYFYVKAFLIDTVDYAPVSAVHNNAMYTREMQEFLSKTTDDFEDEKVVNFDDSKTNNFAVLSDDVIILNSENGTNNASYVDVASQIYIIENIDQTVSSLNQGDTFSFYYNDEIFIVTIGEIYIDGTTATILGDQAELEEVFDYVRLDDTTGITEDTVDEASCGEGVSFEGYETPSTYSLRALDIDKTIGLDAKFKIDLIKVGDEGSNIGIIGNFNLKMLFSPKLYVSKNYKYIEIKFDYELNGGVNIEGEFEIETPIAFLTFGLPGVRAQITPKFVVSTSGSVGITGTLLKGTIGYGWYSDVGGVNLCSTPKVDVEIKAEVTVFLGLRVDPKIKLAEGFLAELGIEANLGAEAKASLGGSFSDWTDKSKKHSCEVCMDGELYGKFDLSVKGSLLKNEHLSLEFKLLEIKVKITNFYWSMTYEEFGFSNCPHFSYKLDVVVSDSFGRAIKNAAVSITSETTFITGKNGKIYTFLPNGSYKVTVSKEGFASVEKTIIIKDEAKSVKIQLEDDSSASANVPSKILSTSGGHSGVIDKNGDLYVWGANYCGQIGDGTMNDCLTPKKIMNNVASICIEGSSSAAIKNNGDLFMWGSNYYGELGDGSLDSSSIPQKIMSNVVSVSCSGSVSAAVTKNGDLYVWGNNRYGQIGDGTTTDCLVPKKIMSNVASVAVGEYHCAAIAKNGDLYTWGNNDDGQLGNDSYTSSLIPVKIMEKVSSVSLGSRHSAAITDTGELYTWGDNYYSQGGCGPTYDKTAPQKIMNDVAKVNLGSNHSSAITTSGELYLWGGNRNYQIGDGTYFDRSFPKLIMSDVAEVDLGGYLSIVITNAGEVYAWGVGYLGDGTDKSQRPKLIPIPCEFSTASMPVMLYSVMPVVDDVYVSTFEDLEPNTVYNFYAMLDRNAENAFATENLIYTNQAKTDENGTVTFEYMNISRSSVQKFVVKFKNAMPDNTVSDIIVTADAHNLFVNVTDTFLLENGYENITAKITINDQSTDITSFSINENKLKFTYNILNKIEDDTVITVQLLADLNDITYENKTIYCVLSDCRSDVNADSEVNSLDLNTLRKMIFTHSFDEVAKFDPNGDGEINIVDLVRIKKYLLN